MLNLRKLHNHLILVSSLTVAILLLLSTLNGNMVTYTYAQAPSFDYVTPILEAVNMDELKQYVYDLSDFKSRFTGYSGCYAAADYIEQKFRSFGITNVERHVFNVVTPVDEGAYLELPSGERITLYPMFPNKVCPPQTPPGGLKGRLIYVGDGTLEDLERVAKNSGRSIEGSVVLMNFNTQYNWVTAAKYGAKAAIFIEPEDMSMMEAWMKFDEYVAWNFPRLYVKAEDAQKLLEASIDEPTVTLVSNMKWRLRSSYNIIAYLPGKDYPDKYVLITAGYDSFSFIPSLAPGARQAIGMAIVLQLAKYYATHPGSNKYTLVFIAFSGTNQGVIGSRWFVKEYIDENWSDWGSKVMLQINFDISDANNFMMPTHVAGWTTEWREGVAPWVTGYEDWLFRTLIPDLAKRLNRPELAEDQIIESAGRKIILPRRIFRGMLGSGGPGHGITYHDYLGSPHRYMNSEPLLVLGGSGYSWTNWQAYEKYYYTPFDSPDTIKWDNIKYMLEAIYPIVHATINEDLSKLIGSWKPGPPGIYYPKWVDTMGEVKRYNVISGWYDPVPNALIVYTRGGPSGIGIQTYARLLPVYDISDSEGNVFLPGLMQAERVGGYSIEAFVVDESTGNVVYAPGFGARWYPNQAINVGGGNRWSSYSNEVLGAKTQSFGVYTVFECGSIVLFDVAGDIYYRSGSSDAQTTLIVHDFVSHAPPEQWSWDVHVYGGYGLSVSVLFVPPDQPIEILGRTTYTLRYPMSLMTNSSEDALTGLGFKVSWGEQYILTYTALKAAEDLHRLNMERMQVLKVRGVSPAGTVDTEPILDELYSALKKYEYPKIEALSNKLLVLERENYANLRSTIEDTIYAIAFFGLTLIPFALIAERLFVGTMGPKRILSALVLYIVPLMFFWSAHPGFALASNPLMVVIGFLVIVLIAPLFAVMFNIIMSTVKRLTVRAFGVHWVEMPRFSVALLGFSTGISHMRKRKLLTGLTMVSAILITMSISMFTSMLPLRVLQEMESGIPASYDGILVRQWEYSYGGFSDGEQTVPQAGQRLLDEFKARYGDLATVAPRAWAWIGYVERGIRIMNSEGELSATPIIAMLGFVPEEQNVTRPQISLIDGTWFTKEMDGKNVCIVSKKRADEFNLKVGDNVWLSGYNFKIVGIVDDDLFLSILELDNTWITPYDPRLPGYESRIPPNEILILPYKTLLTTFKGWIANIAIKFKPEFANKDVVFSVAKEIFKETTIPLYIGLGGKGYTVSARSVVSIFGWQYQAIPLITAVTVILGLIIGSIEQRRREIHVLSTVGLSPFHVAFLFLSESVTYSVVGGILGYLLGIVSTIFIKTFTPAGVGLELNYASTTVVTTVSTLMFAIICVTIYPMYRASKLVTPSLERKWKLPKPKGDTWEVSLPFTITEDIKADGVLAFVYELLTGHVAEDSEIFRTYVPVNFAIEESKDAVIRGFRFDSALAPYELGIMQSVSILDIKEIKAGRHSFLVRLDRKSGPRGSWITFGREFIDLMRKQVLLYGSLEPEEREKYQERFKSIIEEIEKIKQVGG